MLNQLLDQYRAAAVTAREKGTYFEELILCYFRYEASYRQLYQQVWTYAEWAASQGLDRRDTGIDLVAKTRGTEEYHAIQCKLYASDYQIQKGDIDSFFTASGQRPFSYRIIVSTTNHWSEHAEAALQQQQPPVMKIDLHELEKSQIDWSRYQPQVTPLLRPQKQPRAHQVSAIKAVQRGLKEHERGKLIMACGTGKTFTSLKIAESVAGAGGLVLFLVPSLALLAQTLTEWTQESSIPLHSFAVCSDSDVGKKRKSEADAVEILTHELRYPATTSAARLATELAKRHDAEHLSVVFSTYHSIAVLHQAQQQYGLADFKLIISDEAHRTTGTIFVGQEESAFVRIHDQNFIRADKRLYMTATPRIYGSSAKISAELERITLCSMDDSSLYGPDLYVLTFSEAVQQQLLVDYKVIVLAVDVAYVSQRLQGLLTDANQQIKMDDAAKIIGCWKALSKQNLSEQLLSDSGPMRRAVAFCQVIETTKSGKVHKISSKQIARMFQAVVAAYIASETDELEDLEQPLICVAEHVDGSMNASEKEAKLQWLKATPPEHTCRILSNVRCLTEGVDVPALDAILFLTPRNSPIDVVQSVGRVMRQAPGKLRGYVILPVVIPAHLEPHEALQDNKNYAVVWQVLQALRSHDDRFDAMINKMDLTGPNLEKIEVIAITNRLTSPSLKAKERGKGKVSHQSAGRGEFAIGEKVAEAETAAVPQAALQFEIGEIERAIYAKVVHKVGNRQHWEDWAGDVAKIANAHMERLQAIVQQPDNSCEREAFERFARELRANLNDSISTSEVIELLAQHLITKPVFDALFAGYAFTQHNPLSQALQGVLASLPGHNLQQELESLAGFYKSVQLRAEGIDNAAGRQRIIVELYDKFFRNTFPRLTARLGIVYTPVEVVDFILHSVNQVLEDEFGHTLGSPGVQILDPFTGTGTFITRLLHSGLITPEQLDYKYQHDIHANEIVLLAYYIAAINIESVYHDLMLTSTDPSPYQPFPGICLTDTFQLYEQQDLLGELLLTNSTRRREQKSLPIQVIIGNPPYSAGQNSANDNNQNLAYPGLDERIAATYVKRSNAALSKGLYDSYIRAIRWASDRIGDSGVIGFVSGSGFIEKPAMDGMRRCLAEDFSHIYILNLRGDIRKNMLSKGQAQEGQNIFGSSSMTGIVITLFVKNPQSTQRGLIKYYDIGNGLTCEQKLASISQLGTILSITTANAWQLLTPDQHGDWLRQRDASFKQFIAMGDKKDNELKLFANFSLGIVTSRDSWCYNASKPALAANMQRMIAFYNEEVARFAKAYAGVDKKSRAAKVDDFIATDPTKISWSRGLKQYLVTERQFNFEANCLTISLYRPFTKNWLYFNRYLNEVVLQMPHLFPDATAENRVICVSGIGARSGFSVNIADKVPDLQAMDNGQCFPLYLYDPSTPTLPHTQDQLFADPNSTPTTTRPRHYAITDAGLAHFQAAYPTITIDKESLFYYIYGLLHSPTYRQLYADNLSKQLPRIPCIRGATAFEHFTHAGRQLAELHLNYETAALYPLQIKIHHPNLPPPELYRVVKMRYGKQGTSKDLTTIVYNNHITISGIPQETYTYLVNGKPALDWVVERQGIKTDKVSGIINDANAWAIETMHNPRYPLELIQRVVTVSPKYSTKLLKPIRNLEIFPEYLELYCVGNPIHA